ncbi:MAG: hypothetical protein ABF649_06900 [Bacillus sp. (in: firmicutes)]
MKNSPYFLSSSRHSKEISSEKSISPTKIIRLRPIESPQDRKKLLKKIQISSHFNMRFSALYEFYGDDLIDYKQDHFSDSTCNEFLRIFSRYMTDYLKEKTPSSWEECKEAFWEKLILLYFPLSIKITPNIKETKKFISELQKFTQWLDHRANTNSAEIISKFNKEFDEINSCEYLLNHLILTNYPNIHQKNWDCEDDFIEMDKEFFKFTHSIDGLFVVTSIIFDTVGLTEIDTNQIYHLKGLPLHLMERGMILHGIIGKKTNDMFWKWHQTERIYPQSAKKYFLFV